MTPSRAASELRSGRCQNASPRNADGPWSPTAARTGSAASGWSSTFRGDDVAVLPALVSPTKGVSMTPPKSSPGGAHGRQSRLVVLLGSDALIQGTPKSADGSRPTAVARATSVASGWSCEFGCDDIAELAAVTSPTKVPRQGRSPALTNGISTPRARSTPPLLPVAGTDASPALTLRTSPAPRWMGLSARGSRRAASADGCSEEPSQASALTRGKAPRPRQVPLSHGGRIALEVIDKELASCYAKRVEVVGTINNLREEIASSRVVERQELADMWNRYEEIREKRLLADQKVRSMVRTWVVRWRFRRIIALRKRQMCAWAAKLPAKLADQLMEMGRHMHALRYRLVEQQAAAIILQAWWRGLMTRRAAIICRTVKWVRHLHRKMESCAIKLQARFRARKQRNSFVGQLRAQMLLREEEKLEVLQVVMEKIIALQRFFRARFCAKQVAKLMKVERAKYVQVADDMYTMGSLDEGSFADGNFAVEAEGQLAVSAPPFEDPRLSELETRGGVPFFSGAALGAIARHRIGGDTALSMQHLLLPLDAAGGVESSPTAEMAVDWSGLGEEDFYPLGITKSFASDAWDVSKARKSRRRPLERKLAGGPSRRPRMERPARAPPSNAEKRAMAREVLAASREADLEKRGALEACEEHTVEDHPLLVCAPLRHSAGPPQGPAPLASGRLRQRSAASVSSVGSGAAAHRTVRTHVTTIACT
eukprot:TRINITY_DN36806_c1_g1_i1.p1 TRINITY_DN36806_c1_g1~~TRINITY_DN36806_c1_g1_i1.p1  ORF type:complete len:711 (+),score=116.23 TRINITY_DN36806_c1_g1_i1:69-2201(+)